MATVTITIPDALVPRMSAAARGLYPDLATGLTDVQLFKQLTADHWRQILARWEGTQANNQATTDAGGIG